jgi:hypothetical protein
MDAEPPQRAGGDGARRRKDRRAFWSADAGAVAGLAIAVVSVLGDVNAGQAIALGLPAALLTFGGLAVTVPPDAETAERQGFRAGLTTGPLIRWWRSVSGRRCNDVRP